MALAASAGSALLERDESIASLHDAFAEARIGRGSLVLVSGEAGVGKTTLARCFADDLGSTAQVLWGGCDALFTPRPLGPFVEIAHEAGTRVTAAIEQHASAHAVATALLGEADRRTPTVLVVEDLHCADEATLDVVRVLGRRVDGTTCLVVATYRDDQLDRSHPLRIVLGDLATSRAVRRTRLAPLSPEAVAELAAPHGVDPTGLYEITSGNPFFVTEVLATGGETLPHTVRDAVYARLARASGPAREVLEVVAVASAPQAELWLLEAVADGLHENLEECLSSGMLDAHHGAVAFRHDLARIAVEDSLSPTRATALHRAMLDALATRGGTAPDLARLAHHAVAAGDAASILEYAPAAAAHASSLGAHREAVALYEQAQRHVGALEPAAAAELLRRFSHECYLTDRMNDAIDALNAAVSLYRSLGDRLNEGDTLRSLAEILWCPGRGDEGRPTGLEAIAILEELEPQRELGLAYVNQSFLLRTVLDLDESAAYVSRAAALAETLDDEELRVASVLALGQLEGITDYEGGIIKLERAFALADGSGHHVIAGIAMLGAARLGLQHRRYDLAVRFVDTGVAYCADHGLDLDYLYLRAHQARVLLDQGHWADAVEPAEYALRQRVVSTFPRTLALCVLALLRARRGDPDPDSLLEEAASLAEPTGELPRTGLVAAARAEVAWIAGRPERIGKLTEAAFALALEKDIPRYTGELAVWRARAGLVDDLPGNVDEPNALELAGDHLRAADAWDALGCPYESALALAHAPDENSLRRALDVLHRLEARPVAAIVARRLRDLGVGAPRGPRASTRAHPAGLTSRELDVPRHLVEGLRNGDIAERLVLSPRTVDHHVSSILRKLNVGSRAEAVTATTRLGLLKDR